MFTRNSQHVYQSSLLALPWLMHGFGTRESREWPPPYTQLCQIHSNIVVIADGRTGRLEEGDALVSSEAGNLVGVRTADCVPILIACERPRVVAAVHAGWRGTVSGIAAKAIRGMAAVFGANLNEMVGAIGPAIGPCCFEVGPEVSGQFADLFPELPRLTRRVDLPEANRRQLISTGMDARRIEKSGFCTFCGSEFHSYRRDQEKSGRMVSAIGIRP